MFENNDEIRLDKLHVNTTFIYEKQTWTISEICEYCWKTGEISIEYTLKNDRNEIAFLEVEIYRGETELCFSETLQIESHIALEAIESEHIVCFGKNYNLEDLYEGSYKNLTNGGSRENVKSYTFYKGSKMINIEIWDENMEVYIGKEIKKKHIKNITQNR